jgi:hypothetical protein
MQLVMFSRALCADPRGLFSRDPSGHNPGDIERIIANPPNHDQAVWLYESLRQVMVDLNEFVMILGTECTAASCPKMCATENWIFLCAAHGGKQPKECCAIDYILHTLTNFSVMLTAPDAFPNRYTISAKSAQQFGNIARRLYRVFAHAYYHHRALFDQMEARTHLTKRFIQFSLKYELMTQPQLTPPIEL